MCSWPSVKEEVNESPMDYDGRLISKTEHSKSGSVRKLGLNILKSEGKRLSTAQAETDRKRDNNKGKQLQEELEKWIVSLRPTEPALNTVTWTPLLCAIIHIGKNAQGLLRRLYRGYGIPYKQYQTTAHNPVIIRHIINYLRFTKSQALSKRSMKGTIKRSELSHQTSKYGKDEDREDSAEFSFSAPVSNISGWPRHKMEQETWKDGNLQSDLERWVGRVLHLILTLETSLQFASREDR
ncbi:hypothetical protein J6590_036480 [Homalodisca vitripennis]|nr:hypothetical protein J6590_036480 [Homalodisca vitripennis]